MIKNESCNKTINKINYENAKQKCSYKSDFTHITYIILRIFSPMMEEVGLSELLLSVDSRRYNSMSSASFSEKSDILDSLSELTFSWPRSASSVAYFFTYSTKIRQFITNAYLQIQAGPQETFHTGVQDLK